MELPFPGAEKFDSVPSYFLCRQMSLEAGFRQSQSSFRNQRGQSAGGMQVFLGPHRTLPWTQPFSVQRFSCEIVRHWLFQGPISQRYSSVLGQGFSTQTEAQTERSTHLSLLGPRPHRSWLAGQGSGVQPAGEVHFPTLGPRSQIMYCGATQPLHRVGDWAHLPACGPEVHGTRGLRQPLAVQSAVATHFPLFGPCPQNTCPVGQPLSVQIADATQRPLFGPSLQGMVSLGQPVSVQFSGALQYPLYGPRSHTTLPAEQPVSMHGTG